MAGAIGEQREWNVDLSMLIENDDLRSMRGIWRACDGPEVHLRIDDRRRAHVLIGTYVLR